MTKDEPKKDEELAVLAAVAKKLNALQPEQRDRVIAWLVGRFGKGE